MKKIITFLLSVCMIVLLMPSWAQAASIVGSGYCGDPAENDGKNVTWTLDDQGTLTFRGTGRMKDYYNSTALWATPAPDPTPWYSNKSYNAIKNTVFEYGITSIGDYILDECENLEHVTIPSSVVSIGKSAFGNCQKLADISIPNSVTTIGGSAFFQCRALTSVTIPSSVISMDGSFGFCANLAEINVDVANPNYSSIDGVLFNKDQTTLLRCPVGYPDSNYSIPSSVRRIAEQAFSGCTHLKNVVIPHGVTSLEYGVFQSSGITSVSIPDSVTNIDTFAFIWCYYLSDITIPNSVTNIGERAFEYCQSLTNIILPNGITNIGTNTFYRCEKLESITIPESVTDIGYAAFSRCDKLTDIYYGGGETQWQSVSVGSDNNKLTNATIHYNSAAPATIIASGICGAEGDGSNLTWMLDSDGVLTISGTGTMAKRSGRAPWYDHSSAIQSVVIESGVTTISSSAFSNLDNLTNVVLSHSVKEIGAGAFTNNNKMSSISVDDSNVAFSSENGILFNKNRTTLICYPAGKAGNTYQIPSTVTTIEYGAFRRNSYLTKIYIPSSTKDIGKSAFAYCWHLSSISVDSDNHEYCSEDGVLFDKTKSTLICYPANKQGQSYQVPNTVTNIDEYAFSGCNSITAHGSNVPAGLTNLSLSNNLTSIGPWAFGDCSALKRIFIPESIINIDDWIFCGNTILTDIYYGGTESNWNSILIGNYNTAFDGATIHYESTGIEPMPIPVSDGFAAITAFWPEPAKVMDLDHPTNGTSLTNYLDNKLRIFFDREVESYAGRAHLDLTKGKIQIHRASDDYVVYTISDYSIVNSEYSSDIPLWGTSAPYQAIRLEHATTNLSKGEEYYVTMPEGFIKFTDGTVSPEIKKGDWTFKTAGNSPAVTITLPSTSGTMKVGETKQLTPTVSDSNAGVDWTSSNTSVATVSSGLITAKAKGTTTITATVRGTSVSVSYALTVTEDIAPIKLNWTSSVSTLSIGTCRQFTVDNKGEELIWSSSNEDVAAVDQSGQVTALKEGETTILVMAKKDPLNSAIFCKVTVTKSAASNITITLSSNSGTMTVGETRQLKATVSGTNGAVAWTSSKPSVVTVNNSGLIMAKAKGTAIVTATVQGTSVSASYALTVTEDAITISLNTKNPILVVGDKIQLKASPARDDLRWSSSDTNVLAVDQNGWITAVGEGKASVVVLAAADPLNSAAGCQVTVAPKVSIESKDKLIALEKNDDKSKGTAKIYYSYRPYTTVDNSRVSVTVTSTNEKVVAYSNSYSGGTGCATVVAAGTGTADIIMAVTYSYYDPVKKDWSKAVSSECKCVITVTSSVEELQQKFATTALSYDRMARNKFSANDSKVLGTGSWCAYFIQLCAKKVGIENIYGTSGYAYKFFLETYEKSGAAVRYVDTNDNNVNKVEVIGHKDYTPKVGDVLLIDWFSGAPIKDVQSVPIATNDHVEVVCGVNPANHTFTVVGGNTDTKNYSGGRVTVRKNFDYHDERYSKSGDAHFGQIVGIATPNWDAAIGTVNGTVDEKIKCPVDVRYTFNGESLDSATEQFEASFGTMSRTDDGGIFVHLNAYYDVDVEITGYDTGTMTITSTFTDEDGTVSTRVFQEVPITADTVGKLYSSYAAHTQVLELYDADGDNITEAWYATGSETVSSADADLTDWYINGESEDYVITYSIALDANGGSISTAAVEIGADATLASLPTPTRSNYRFDGWYTAATGGTRVTIDTVFDSDTTIYAHWTYIGPSSSELDSSDDSSSSRSNGSSSDRSSDSGDSSSSTSFTSTTTSGRSVALNVNITNATATVQSISDSALSNAASKGSASDPIVFDLGNIGKKVDALGLPASVFSKVAELANASGLTIKLSAGSTTFDDSTLRTIGSQASGQVLCSLTTSADTSGLNNAQRTKLANKDVMTTVKAELTSGGKPISNFSGGKAEISIPLAIRAGTDSRDYTAFYSAENGSLTEQATSVANGNVSFTVGHFSDYIVLYKEFPFWDVADGVWYEQAVRYAYRNDVMSGYSPHYFGPDDSMTRAQIVRSLWNMEGQPTVDYVMQFGDVESNTWYTEAIRWATSKGIVGGYNQIEFGVSDNVTREQLAAILWRYAKYKGVDVDATGMDISSYADGSEVTEYFTVAMQWACGTGIISGTQQNSRVLKLAPKDSANRAQVATMLMRFCKNFDTSRR